MKKYRTEFTKEELHKALHSKDNEAAAMIKDVNKWDTFKIKFNEFMKKAKKVPVLGGMLDDIICMISLADSYIKNEYRDIPVGTVISIVAALIYLLSPIDLIPDFVPVVGYLDDATVIFLVLSFGVDKDLDKYRKWNESKRKNALDNFEKTFAEEIAEIVKDEFISAVILCEDKTIKLLVTENQISNKPIECLVNVINAPVSLFNDFGIEDNNQMLEILNDTVKMNGINWVKNTDQCAYLEYDFDDKWDDYIIMEVD